MYGKEKTISRANRCYQADAGSSGGKAGEVKKDDAKASQNKVEGPDEQELVRDAQTKASKASEDRTAQESAKAQTLNKTAGLKPIDPTKYRTTGV